MNKAIELSVNNNQTLFLTQASSDGDTILNCYDGDKMTYECSIPAGDMVMLLNFYRYVKRYDIQNDFINPSGKNHDDQQQPTPAGSAAQEQQPRKEAAPAAQEEPAAAAGSEAPSNDYCDNYKKLYKAADKQLRKETREHWTKCHEQNIENGRNDMIIFSGKILAAITAAEIEEAAQQLQQH